MKTFLFAVFISFSAHAIESYPLQFGIGTDRCYPNEYGLTQCKSYSPKVKEISVPLKIEPEQTAAYGFYSNSGTFEKIGFEVSVKIVNFPNLNIDDMLILKVVTWKLTTPDEKHEVVVESFTRGPENLNRLNLPGFAIGSEENYSNVILSVRKSAFK